jgi:chromosomal replication initiator protein
LNERTVVLETLFPDQGTARSDVAASPPPRAATAAEIGAELGAGEFAAGPENRSTVAAARLFIEAPRLGPLVLHGPSGIGKTTLVRDVLSAWSAARPDDLVASVSGAEFAEQYAAAVDADRIETFRRKFHDCDLLTIDAVDQLRSKPAAQGELLLTLDVLESRGAAVLMTLHAAPARTDWLSPQLAARLAGGLVVEIAPPSPAARRTILERLAARTGRPATADAVEALAADRSRSVAEMTGLFLALQQQAAADGRTLDTAAVREALHRRDDESTPTLKRAAEEAARRFGLTIADLKGQSRRRTVVAARDAAILTARRLSGRTLAEIGKYFGGRDHTTVMHSCRKLEELLERDAETRTMIDELCRATRDVNTVSPQR